MTDANLMCAPAGKQTDFQRHYWAGVNSTPKRSLCFQRTWQLRLNRRESNISSKQSGTDSPGETRRPAPKLVKSHTMQSIVAAESAVTILPDLIICVRCTRLRFCMNSYLMNAIGRLRLRRGDFVLPKTIEECRGYRGQISRLSEF